MGVVAAVLALVAQLYVLLLLARLVTDLVVSIARSWRPRGAVVVVMEIIYTVTDPPLRLARRFIRPVRLGMVSLDVAFMLVLVVVMAVASLLAQYAIRLSG
ncbi:MAG: YggT family protein [Bifidobacteriaceae bacterium]|nr:YggT family protein [Bifidobacteriaceae bacterium]